MASAQDRKNQLVWDSIDVAAFKQALQLCNRRIKKGEKGDYLMVTQFMKYHMGNDITNYFYCLLVDA